METFLKMAHEYNYINCFEMLWVFSETAGLKCGDQILESNGIDVEKASSQRAVELLSSSPSHTLVVRRTRKIPEWKVTKERILW